MATPHAPHFFKPLLPGFYSGVHIEGRTTNQNTWKLRSDASDQTWEVIQEGRRLTGGWKDFCTAHDLRIGDLVILKLVGEMEFHVTPFGPSCCEIQYTHPHIKEEVDADDDNDIRAMSFDYCFLAEVTASNLKEDKLYLPVGGTNSNALNKQCKDMIIVNKEGSSWTMSLGFRESDGKYYIRRGWRRLCLDNMHMQHSRLICIQSSWRWEYFSIDVCMSGKKRVH